MPKIGTAVESTADIVAAHHDISPRDAAAIRTLLDSHPNPQKPSALWIAEWLVDEKPLIYVEGPSPVAEVSVTRETEKAWFVTQADADHDGLWIPKSQAMLFRAADGVDRIASAQQTLGGGA